MGESDGLPGRSLSDPVTGAFPRGMLEPRVAEELSRAIRGGRGCALFLFDVDFFKTVNDTYGHLRGDEALRWLADRVTALVRGYDLLFRYGGDEFVLLLPDTGRSDAIHLALRLVEGIRAEPFGTDPPLHLSVSLGVASYPEDGSDVRSLLDAADRRNYLAKRRGRGVAVADDASTDGPVTSGRLWERDAPLATAHAFLTRLSAERRGALRVHGPPGAGHTRFLTEFAAVAAMRGLVVITAAGPAEPAPAVPTDPERGVLVVADIGSGAAAAVLVHALVAGPVPPPTVGLVYATTDERGAPPAGELPVLDSAELAPWSSAALRIWLRSTLMGEPSPSLVTWFAGQSGGLPGRAARELDRLRAAHGLVATGAGGWTVAPPALGPRRRLRLPAQLTTLLGRDTDRDRVVALLAENRLVTLVGPGGIGKTRLSLAVAAAVTSGFSDGVAFVPLADADSTDLVVAAVARALRISEMPGEPLLDTVIDELIDSSLLLVLDNAEQVLQAGALVAELLAAAPAVSALVTSREPLAIYGEQVYPVPPLKLPESGPLPGGRAGVKSVLDAYPAVALFEQRARSADPGFTLTPDTLADVVELCRRMDGLPLAIELAAARADRWSPATVLAKLVSHLDALGAGPRDRPGRQQTLRGAIDWSFDLLAPDQQELFVTLAVFTGSWTVEAALAVVAPSPGGAQPSAELSAQLRSLAGKSLLVEEVEADGQHRFDMLATIHAYAAESLAASPEAGQTRDRHASYCVTVAESSAAGMAGPEQSQWAERLERDYKNLRAAIDWTLARGDRDSAGRICLGLWRYWVNGNHTSEGRAWLARVLDGTPDLPEATLSRLLYPASVLASGQDDFAAGAQLGARCLRLAESTGDRRMAAHAHNAIGIAATGSGDYPLASAHLTRTLALWDELGEAQGRAIALGNLAKLALQTGHHADAHHYIEQCLTLERAAGNTRGIVLGLECLGQILLARGDRHGAQEALREGLTRSRDLGDVFGSAMALHQLGLIAALDGDRDSALSMLTSALAHRYQVGDRQDLAASLDCVAGLAVADRPELAVRLLSCAEELRRRHRLPTPQDGAADRAGAAAAAQLTLGEAAFRAAWAAGRDASLDLLVNEVLDITAAA